MLAKVLCGFIVMAVAGFAQAAGEWKPSCQVKLLRVASVALEKEFAKKAGTPGVITEVLYNYNLKGIPRAIFLSRLASDDDQVCFIDVRTTVTDELGTDGCPDYQFQEVRSTCK